ncbi:MULTISPECIES: hypothetical protein [Streptomyces rochei group]|uniref:hypothetical protein n=1 Tax=Streptomyces rochei group TaxID=2867164 RepID=UPI001876F620|nr:hypothetical protein [Streptomyces vinaceusdrappus]GHC44344.1 hypothetical protein GCM10010308_74480 [Streptomyces vinaceusdrappus]
MTALARVRTALAARRHRRDADRALMRLAREACVRADCPTCLALNAIAYGDPRMHADHLAATAIDERSPEWCHRHGCPLSQCDPRGH